MESRYMMDGMGKHIWDGPHLRSDQTLPSLTKSDGDGDGVEHHIIHQSGVDFCICEHKSSGSLTPPDIGSVSVSVSVSIGRGRHIYI